MPASIIIFTRFPEAGKAKTRLIPSLGDEGAAELQRRMTRLAVARAAAYCHGSGGRLVVAHEGGDARSMRQWLGRGPRYRPQEGNSLGERMQNATRDEFQRGAGRVILIGADCPRLTPDHLRKAEASLADSDLVFGPTTDGGYYLLGMTRNVPRIFEAVPWGTGRVMEISLERASECGVPPRLLDTLPDVDIPGDLEDAEKALSESTRVSVIIPTLNEEENLARLLPLLRHNTCHEVIVSDGGSTDASVAVAKSHEALVLVCGRGRALQMNAGAVAARGEYLLFLHADTFPPSSFESVIRDHLDDPSVVAGSFGFRLGESIRGGPLIEALVALRCRLFQLPYGDQGLFIRKDLFHALGGFPNQPILEDLVFVETLRRIGKVVTSAESADTSARRWRNHGVFKTFLSHLMILIGHRLGFSPERLRSLRPG